MRAQRTNQSNFLKASLFAGFAGFTAVQMMQFQQQNLCQAGVDPKNDYGGRLTTINHLGAVKYLMSQLRDKKSDTIKFRQYSDRIMRLLVEEALSQDLGVEKRQSPTGDYYDHYDTYDASEFAAVSIMRGGDSMLGEVFDLIPGIAIGKVLI